MSSPEPLPPLTPVRYQPTFFSIDVATLAIKDSQQQLEHPFFSLSKTPDTTTRHYEDRYGNTLTVRSIDLGLPTIWDKDVLIFAISQIMARRNRGEKVSPTVRFHTADLLEFTNRVKGGSAYQRIDDAIRRLAGCQLETNIKTDGVETTRIFHIIDEATIKRQYNRPDGRLEYVEFTLSDWLWRAIEAKEVLTLHPYYFRLRQAVARRIYEIARKHCGRNPQWEITLPLLHDKSGSKSEQKEFRRRLRKLCEHGDLLDYDMELLSRDSKEIVRFRRREGSHVDVIGGIDTVQLSETVIPAARALIGNAGNVSQVEKDWRQWMMRKGIRPTNAEAFFLSFCRRWAEARASGEDESEPSDKPSFRDKLAEAWWDGLDNNARQHWRDGIGLHAELADGTGWWRSEESLAREAFDRRYPFPDPDPENTEFPQVLLERLSEELEGCGVATETVTAAWRNQAFTYSVLPKINDPLLSLWLFAQDIANGKPAALQAMQAASAPPVESRQKRVDSWQLAYQSRSEFEAWKNRSAAWWKTLPEAKRVEAVAAHGPGPELIRAIETDYIDVDSEQITAVRAYAVIDPPPRNRAGGFAGVKEAMFQASWFSDQNFCEFHDIDFWDDRLHEFFPETWEERVQQWWLETLDWEGQHTAMSAHWNDKPVRAAREAGASKEEVADLVASRAYHRAFPEDSPPPGHPHLA